MATAALLRQVVEKDVTALAVVLQFLQLRLPLSCLLAFLLSFFSLLCYRVGGHGGLTLRFFLLPFLLLFALFRPVMVGFASSITAGGAGPLLFNGRFSGLVWCKEFLGQCLITLLGSILLGGILHWSILGQRALR